VKALTRNTLLAVPLALVLYFMLPKSERLSWDLLDAFTVAFSFTYVGYLVEKALLQLPGIETGLGRVIRVMGWFAGGLWCWVLARWALLAFGRDTRALPSLIWGGLVFVGLQFVVHAMLQASGKPNFYGGQLAETETTAAR
jgi:hypothetical protein